MSSGNQRYINTAGTHNITMGDDFINVSTSVGAITLVFPNIRDSGAINLNKVWFVNDVDDMAATNNVTIVASATNPVTELNGGTSVVLDTNGFSAEIVPSGYYSYMVNSGISDGGMTGSGTLNYVAKFTPSGTVLGNSQLYDNGTNVGLGIVLPTAKYHIKGVDATSSNYALKVDNSASSPLLYVRNDGMSLFSNNDVTISSTAGYGQLDVPSYKAFRFGISGAGGTYIELSHNVGDIKLLKKTVILGGITASSNVSLDVGSDGNASSIGVRNLSLANSTSGSALFGLGTQGAGGANGSATIRVSYEPVSFGGLISDVNNNYFRVGIGIDVVSTHRLNIADGLKVSTGGVNMTSLQTGNAGLVSGDLYVDTAANILANGDLVVGRKV